MMSGIEKYDGYLGRGLHSKKWDELFKEGGKLFDLLEIVRSDEDLVLEIRNDYFNIYYKGGNMLKVGSKCNFQFDHNYFKGYKYPEFEADEKEGERKILKKKLLRRLKEDGDYGRFVVEMKNIMEDYWKWLEEVKNKSLEEKDTQHEMCIRNTESSEYTIIDLEFQVSTDSDYSYTILEKPHGRFVAKNKKRPRFDIVAVRNCDHQLCVIELKKGINAIYGRSGIGDHADSFEGSIGRNPTSFHREIVKVVEDKKQLKLLSEGFHISDSIPEFLYAYVYEEGEDGVVYDKIIQKEKFKQELIKNQCTKYKTMFLDLGDYVLSDKSIEI